MHHFWWVIQQDVTKIKDVTDDTLSSYGENPKSQFVRTSSMNSISNNSENSNTKFSLKDSDGNTLTEKQQEYFKDSKVRDENGNLKVLNDAPFLVGHST